MSDAEFIEKLKKLDPFFHESDIPLDALYEHFKVTVEEMERLEDIEDNTAVMQACIDGLRETIKELRKKLNDQKKI